MLRDSDEAVRLGGKLGVQQGADDRNPEHNKVMYTAGCPWRGNETKNCRIDSMPQLGTGGLYEVVSAFLDSVKKVLAVYGTSPDTWRKDWTYGAGDASAFNTVVMNPAKVQILQSDRKLRFIADQLDGDLSQGLSQIVSILQAEAVDNLHAGLAENKTLYGVYVATVVFMFYFTLFKHTLRRAQQEVERARNFVLRMPLYILSQEDMDVFLSFFKNIEDLDEDDDNEGEPLQGGMSASGDALVERE